MSEAAGSVVRMLIYNTRFDSPVVLRGLAEQLVP